MTARRITPAQRRTRYTALALLGGLLIAAGVSMIWPALGVIVAGLGIGAFGLVSLGLDRP